MLETCPLCSRPLRNGKDGPNKIRYPDEWREKFEAGEISLEELNEHAQVYYYRARLCFNEGNQNKAIRDSAAYKYAGMSPEQAMTLAEANGDLVLLNPPCANFYGIRGGTIENPDVVVEYVTIEDN